MRIVAAMTVSALLLGATGCERPPMPSLNGPNMFHDISKVRKGMSPNEVRRVMGSKFETVWEDGIQGVDGGNYVWKYPEGTIYFSTDGVTKIVTAN